MFQFRRFPTYTYLIQHMLPEYGSGGFPHSDICGSTLICSSPQLFAACHVLLRLLMPRHSPCALFSLTCSFFKLWFSFQELCKLYRFFEIVIILPFFLVPQLLYSLLPSSEQPCCFARFFSVLFSFQGAVFRRYDCTL